MRLYIVGEEVGMKQIKARIRETLCEGVIIVEFPDGTWNTCHVDNIQGWLASKGIEPDEIGVYGKDDD